MSTKKEMSFNKRKNGQIFSACCISYAITLKCMWLKNKDKHENNSCVHLIVGVTIFLFERVYYFVSIS